MPAMRLMESSSSWQPASARCLLPLGDKLFLLFCISRKVRSQVDAHHGEEAERGHVHRDKLGTGDRRVQQDGDRGRQGTTEHPRKLVAYGGPAVADPRPEEPRDKARQGTVTRSVSDAQTKDQGQPDHDAYLR